MNIGDLPVVLRFDDHGILDSALRALGGHSDKVLAVGAKPLTDPRPIPVQLASRAKHWRSRSYPYTLSSLLESAAYEPVAATDTARLVECCLERGWNRILLTHADAVLERQEHLEDLTELSRNVECDVAYDGDCPWWSEVVTLSTLERFVQFAAERFPGVVYPHRFYHFATGHDFAVVNIGATHREYCFNGSFTLPSGGMTIGDQGDVLWRLSHMPDLTGQTVLDVGTEEGYALFGAVERGAAHATGLNIREEEEYDCFPEFARPETRPNQLIRTEACKERTFAWLKKQFSIGEGTVSQKYGNIYNIGDECFDTVFCFGVLYHLRDPFKAIENLFLATGRTLIVEAQGLPDDGTPSAQLSTKMFNMWIFSSNLLRNMLERVGFTQVEVLKESRYPVDSVVLKATK